MPKIEARDSRGGRTWGVIPDIPVGDVKYNGLPLFRKEKNIAIVPNKTPKNWHGRVRLFCPRR
ncbi:MAG: hypothetical protein AAF349_22310 [Cyanobacteria bacterium P01_A01_bin.68]